MQIEIQHWVEQMKPDAGGSGTEKASEEPLAETSLMRYSDSSYSYRHLKGSAELRSSFNILGIAIYIE